MDKRWYFGILSERESNHLLYREEAKGQLRMLNLWNNVCGRGSDTSITYCHLVAWKGNVLLSTSDIELRELSIDEAVRVADEMDRRNPGAYTNLKKMGLPEKVLLAPGIRNYKTSTSHALWANGPLIQALANA